MSYRVLQRERDELLERVDELELELASLREERDLLRQSLKDKKSREAIEKDLAGWGPKELVTYFQIKFRAAYGRGIKVDPTKKLALYTRIRQFQNEQEWSNADYKRFIDKCFQEVFTKSFIPCLAHLTSERTLNLVIEKESQGQLPRKRIIAGGSAKKMGPGIDWESLAQEDVARLGD